MTTKTHTYTHQDYNGNQTKFEVEIHDLCDYEMDGWKKTYRADIDSALFQKDGEIVYFQKIAA